MHLGTAKLQKYYISDKLKRQLSQISQYPLTVVEAPSGFGKTTAIREHLRREHPKAACEWYTCLGEPAAVAWTGICKLFGKVDRKTGDELKNFKIPQIDILQYINEALKNLRCKSETYLIIDNYQRIQFNLHWELLEVLSMNKNPNLHIIIITHPLDSMNYYPIYDNIYKLDSKSFFFEREGVNCLLRMEGIRLTNQELDTFILRTEGWIAAIRLQMINYKETGAFVGSAGIEQLVKTAIWNRLKPEDKDFMLALSVFDSFTAQQAKYMLNYEVLLGTIEEELKQRDFIRFLPDQNLFTIHCILLDYLRNRFNNHRTKEYQNHILHKAGLSCAAIGHYRSAAQFFYQVGNFDSLLSLPFTRQYMESEKEHFTNGLLLNIVRECPEEILCRYPSTMIVFAHFSLLDGACEIYEKLSSLLRVVIHEGNRLPKEEISKISRGLIQLETWGNFNDLPKMQEYYEEARKILGESPDIMEKGKPWFGVFPTILGMFWRETGTLDESLHAINNLKVLYNAFSNGQSRSLIHLVYAETMLNRGEDNEAEILCHKTLREAKNHGQTFTCIYAELCLARIFILRGDVDNFLAVLKNIQEYKKTHTDSNSRRMMDICLAIIGLILGSKEYVASWLYDMESIKKALYVPLVPFAEILHFRLLLMEEKYNELYALIQLSLETWEQPYLNIRYRMPQLYCYIFLAAAKYNNGDKLEAQRCLREAMDISMPDGIYLPFTDHTCIASIISILKLSYSNEEYSNYVLPHEEEHQSSNIDIDKLLSICERQLKGIGVIKKALLQEKSPLTPREREVALLAKERLSAKEIAAKLYISERTVTTILGSVYSKLEINSKRELLYIEF